MPSKWWRKAGEGHTEVPGTSWDPNMKREWEKREDEGMSWHRPVTCTRCGGPVLEGDASHRAIDPGSQRRATSK